MQPLLKRSAHVAGFFQFAGQRLVFFRELLGFIPERFKVLAEVPNSVSHFPDLVSLTPEGGGYTWRMKKLGVGKVSLQAVYACRYSNDPQQLSVWWEPVEGVGNSRVSGRWTLAPAGSGTQVTLENQFAMTFKLPKLMKKVAQGAVVRRGPGFLGARGPK